MFVLWESFHIETTTWIPPCCRINSDTEFYRFEKLKFLHSLSIALTSRKPTTAEDSGECNQRTVLYPLHTWSSSLVLTYINGALLYILFYRLLSSCLEGFPYGYILIYLIFKAVADSSFLCRYTLGDLTVASNNSMLTKLSYPVCSNILTYTCSILHIPICFKLF